MYLYMYVCVKVFMYVHRYLCFFYVCISVSIYVRTSIHKYVCA